MSKEISEEEFSSLFGILKRSVPITMVVFRNLFVLHLLLAGCWFALSVGEVLADDFIGWPMLMALLVFLALLPLARLLAQVVLLADRIWQNKPLDLKAMKECVSYDMIRWYIALWVRLYLLGLFGFFLFIVPGLVYLTNRFLALIIFPLENASIRYSIAKSKLIMSSSEWHSREGPFLRLLLMLFAVFAIGIALSLGIEAMVRLASFLGRDPLLLFTGFFLQGLINCLLLSYAAVCLVGFYQGVKDGYLPVKADEVPETLHSYRESGF